MAKESGIAKSIGDQTEEDKSASDQLLYDYLSTGKKKIISIDLCLRSCFKILINLFIICNIQKTLIQK